MAQEVSKSETFFVNRTGKWKSFKENLIDSQNNEHIHQYQQQYYNAYINVRNDIVNPKVINRTRPK